MEETKLVAVNSENPYNENEFNEEIVEYTDDYWKTKGGYIAISEMDDDHLIRARRHALNKSGNYMKELAQIERRVEIMLLKYRQLNREAKQRGLISHSVMEELVEQ